MPCFLQLKFFFVTTSLQKPGFDRLHDFHRDAESGVDFSVQRFGGCGFPDFQHAAVGCGQNNGRDLMGAELLANAPPRSVNPGLQEPVLDGRQQVIGQHTKEDVGLGPVFQMMKNRPLHERTFHVPECIFHSGQ